MDLMIFILDLVSLELIMSLQQLGRLEALLSTLGVARSDLSVSILALSSFESLLPLQSLSRPGFLVSALDLFHADSSVFIQSFTHLDFSSFIFDLVSLDFLPSLKAASCLEFAAVLLGMSRVGSVFPLLVLDAGHLDSSLPLRSPARLELALLMLVPGHVGRSNLNVLVAVSVELNHELCGQ